MTIFNLTEPVLAFPPVSPLVAASTSSLLTIAYVGNLYVSTATRIGKARSKEGVLLTKEDEPVVRSRLAVASWTSLVGLSATTALIQQRAFPKETPYLFKLLGSLRLVGISLPAPSFLHRHTLPLQPSFTLFSLHHVLPSILVPLALTSVLYAGPLLVSFFDKTLPGQQNSKSLKTWIKDHFGNVWGLRNYVVGPLTEEVVFRGCILGLHALAGASKTAQVFATPLYFGFAHIHHAYESYVGGGRTRSALKSSLLRSLFQFTYTTMFGWYANFLFLRTNSLLAPIAAHVFCNMMNMPEPGAAVERHPSRRWVIYISHMLGIAGFGLALFPWTQPGLFGGSWFWS